MTERNRDRRVESQPLDPERWRRVSEIFEAVLEHDPERRAAALDQFCGGDEQLRSEVERLLAADARASGFLDVRAATLPFPGPPGVSAPAPGLAAGDLLAGRFEVIRFLAAGGMGEVYEARDRELGETVAIKTVRPKLAGDRASMARFRREVQLARRVTHPSICRIYDIFRHPLETTEDGPAPLYFLSMELVAGETLSQRLAQRGRLAAGEALPIVRRVAQALAAAHDVGVVHRDLKSSNVLLAAGPDGDERVVVTDFGLARLSHARVETRAASGTITADGVMLGTPSHMAPEQVTGEAVTPAVDVYALGVLMYEMVTGHLPFEDDDPMTMAFRRLSEEPPRPRTWVDDLPARWEEAILRCLRRQPSERYESCLDVVRFLLGSETAGWRPAPGLTVPQRPNWVLDRKLGEGGSGEAWLGAHRQTGESRVFKFCFDAAGLSTLQREITLFRLLRTELGDRTDIARLIDWNLEQAPYFVESEHTEGGSLTEWAAARGGIGQVPLATRLELVAQVATALAAAHSVGVLHKDVKPGNVLIAEDSAGGLQARLSDFGVGAITEHERLRAAGITVIAGDQTRLSGSSPTGTPLYVAPELLEGKPATLRSDVYALGVMLYQMIVGDLGRALAPGWRREVDDELLAEDVAAAVDGSPERRLGDALRLAERLRGLERRRSERLQERRREAAAGELQASLVRSRRRRRMMGLAIGLLAIFAAAMGTMAYRVAREAERANREAAAAERVSEFLVELFEHSDPFGEAAGEGAPGDATVREVLDRGTERLIAPDGGLEEQPEIRARLLNTIGTVYFGLGLFDQAEPLLDTALRMRRQLLDPDHPDLAETLYNQAQLMAWSGKYDQAVALFREAIAINRKALGPDHPDLGSSLKRLGVALNWQEKFDEAEPYLREALAIQRRALGDHHPLVAETMADYGGLLQNQGRIAEAEALQRQAIAINREALGEDHPDVATGMLYLADVMEKQGRLDEAERLYRESQAIHRRVLGERHPQLITSLANLGGLLLRRGELDEADQKYRESLAILSGQSEKNHVWTAATLNNLARVAVARGEYAEGETLIREALATFRKSALGEGSWRIANAESILGACLAGQGRYREAEELLLASYPIVRDNTLASAVYTRDLLARLVALYESWGKPAEAAEYRRLLIAAGETES